MTSYRGITWDHPRGRNALVAAAGTAQGSDTGLRLTWSAHSLEDFESHPIDDLARNYDLIVLDHPHLGEALEHRSLIPLDAVVGTERIDRWSAQSVGPSFASYSLDGLQWALPLDAATQVAVRKPALVPSPPATWDDVELLSERVPVALSLAGPHAFLTFASLCAAYDAPAGGSDGDGPGLPGFVPDDVGHSVLERLRVIGSRAPAAAAGLNPIALLQRMTDTDEIAYCPLVYGYVNYSSPTLRFTDAPSVVPGGRRGSTLGGTGLAVSSRADVTPALIDHIDWLMSPEAQRRFIPQHDGQPSTRSAWLDDEVNRASAGFYRSTLATIEDSWVRPRFPGYIAFQTSASAIVRAVVAGQESVESGLTRLRAEFSRARPLTTERI
ncbi:ABC transporter substrate-binding protein [Arthrobacter agilis]|uniref:ABC transporter substrate-binding protein n=1 Tax=Arthrobacter agilis TaxID=37921 RepID=UPI00277E4B09|nr:ABC transporter substrate-binding protein [Arthrobacter agilis]MDQ0736859.1 multiple sugar transport system substrate-binding protein [Arthrobacter agilis]